MKPTDKHPITPLAVGFPRRKSHVFFKRPSDIPGALPTVKHEVKTTAYRAKE